jgi:hypothetical protein
VQKQALVLVGLVLLLIVFVALISALWPRSEEKFVELGLLGKDQKAEGYFVNDNPTLEVGSQVDWYIYLHNHMGSEQYASVRIKLLNSTMEVPNDQEHNPSPYASITEFPVHFAVNDTELIPFSWGVSDAVYQNDSIIIEHLVVNGQTVDVNVSASGNPHFYLVFELWVYDHSSNEYKFGWESGKGFVSASVNMWFNVSLS